MDIIIRSARDAKVSQLRPPTFVSYGTTRRVSLARGTALEPLLRDSRRRLGWRGFYHLYGATVRSGPYAGRDAFLDLYDDEITCRLVVIRREPVRFAPTIFGGPSAIVERVRCE